MRNEKGQFIKKEKLLKNCLICKKDFYVDYSVNKKSDRKFCTMKCYGEFRKGKPMIASFKGKKHTEKWKEKQSENNLGDKSHFWKGGISKMIKNCEICGKKLSCARSVKCRKCLLASLTGENNPNYKNGLSRTTEYRLKKL